MTPDEHNYLYAAAWRIHAVINNLDEVQDGPTKGEKNLLKVALAAKSGSSVADPTKFSGTLEGTLS